MATVPEVVEAEAGAGAVLVSAAAAVLALAVAVVPVVDLAEALVADSKPDWELSAM